MTQNFLILSTNLIISKKNMDFQMYSKKNMDFQMYQTKDTASVFFVQLRISTIRVKQIIPY